MHGNPAMRMLQSVSILRQNRLFVRLIRRDSSQRASHVRVENLQSVHVASINPTEPVTSTLALDPIARQIIKLTLHEARP